MVKSGTFFISEKGGRDNRFDLILLLLLHRNNFHFETFSCVCVSMWMENSQY